MKKSCEDFMVAIGMPVARHPSHRSRRALLTHRAPTSGRNVPSQVGVRMINAGLREPAVNESGHSFPIEAMALTASLQDLVPQSTDIEFERFQFPTVPRHTIIPIMSE